MSSEKLKELQNKVKKAELYEKVKTKVWNIFTKEDTEPNIESITEEVVEKIREFCDSQINEIAGVTSTPTKRPQGSSVVDPEPLEKGYRPKAPVQATDAAGRPVDELGDPMDPISFSMKYIKLAKESKGLVMLKTTDNQEVSGKLINAKYPHLIIQLEDGRTIPALRSDVRFL